MSERRVLVCGSRRWDDANRIYGALRLEAETFGSLVVIHGAALGADAIASQWARDHGHKELAFPADWKTHGKAAGPIRNQQMLIEGNPDVVLAYPTHDSVGTWDMIARAGRAGVPVHVLSDPLVFDGSPDGA